MKLYVLRQVAVLSVLLVLSGCSMKTEVPPLVFEQQPQSVDLDNRYYLYIEAQLHRKKGDIDKAVEYLKGVIALEDESVFLHRELASLYMEQKKPEKAMAELEKILDNEPMDADTLIIYGRLNQNLGRMEKAKDAYEKALSVDLERENVYNALGRIYMAEDDLTSAARIYGHLLQHYPGSFIGHFYMGKIYAKQGKRKKAETEFEKTLTLEPELLEPRFELIELLKADRRGAKKRDKIIRLYEDILEGNPEDARAAIELGLFYHKIGQKADAEKILKGLGQRPESDKIVLTTMVREYFEKERYRDVKTVLLYMLKGAPENSDFHYVLALALNELEEKDRAVENFTKVMPDSRFFTNAVINTALIYQEGDNLDDAAAYLQSAIRKAPDNAEFMLYLGTIFEEKQAYERAEKVLKQGLEKDDQNPKLYFRLGVVYDKWGRKDDCIAAMKTVISIDPNHANALNYLGYTYADLGQKLDEAEQLVKRALKQKPDDGYITDSLGWVYFKRGQYLEALKVMLKAVSLVPDDPIILEHLGDVYLKLDNPLEAEVYYRRSLKNKKEDKAEIENKIRDLKRSTP